MSDTRQAPIGRHHLLLAILIAMALLAIPRFAGSDTAEAPQSEWQSLAASGPVAIDGSRALVGSWVHELDRSGSWQPVQQLLGGTSVALDGDTAVLGSGSADTAWVFVRDESGTWIQQAELVPPERSSGFGDAVGIAGDSVIVGAKYDSIGTGQYGGTAHVFNRNDAGEWTHTKRLLPVGGSYYEFFGATIAMDGDTALIGAPGEDSDVGCPCAVYVFERDNTGSWVQQQVLEASNAGWGDYFGDAVALDGDTAVVGARSHDVINESHAGATYVFERATDGTWSETANLIAGDFGRSDGFGASVGIDGNTLVVGAWLDDDNGEDAGAAYLFVRDREDRWIQRSKLLASDGAPGDRFGRVAAIGGRYVMAGTPNYVFELGSIRIPTLLRHTDNHRWFTYELQGTDIVYKGFLRMSRSSDDRPVSRADFNGDGQPDLLLRRVTETDSTEAGTENQPWSLYLLRGEIIFDSGHVPLTRDADWQVMDTSDYDGDGKADVLLRHAVDGRWYLYLMDGFAVKSQGRVAASTDLADTWQGSAMLDGDEGRDFILRNDNGAWTAYFFSANAATKLDSTMAMFEPAETELPWTNNFAFRLESLDDFNGDGKDDALLRKDQGRWFIYLMDGASVIDQGSPLLTRNPELNLQTTADFSGDGNADLLIRHADGRWFLHELDGLSVIASGQPQLSRHPDMGIVDVADLDFDGKADLLMRRPDGPWNICLMNGTQVRERAWPDMVRSDKWVVVVEPATP